MPRYQTSESTYLTHKFKTGDTVTITLYDMSDDSVATLDDNSCPEIGSTGVFKWNIDNITTTPTTKTEYLYIMTNGSYNHYGKLVMGGYLDNFEFTSKRIHAHIKATDNIDLTALQKASVKSQVDSSHNSAIPDSPTEHSINERVKSLDDLISDSKFPAQVKGMDAGVLTSAAVAASFLEAVFARSKYAQREQVEASGAVLAQGITNELAASGCIQYEIVRISMSMNWGSPDITFYILYHYDSNFHNDILKPSLTTTW